MVPSILQGGLPTGVYSFDEIFLLQSLVLRSFLVHLRYSFFNFFFHIHLFDVVRFHYSQVLVSFVFSKSSFSFLIWQFRSLRNLSFSASHLNRIFFSIKFHSYILTVYSYCLYESLQFCFTFCKQLDVVHVHWVVDYYYYYYYYLGDFHTSVRWWSFTEIWVTVSLLRFPGIFSVFWSILTMLYFGWSWFIIRFTTLPVPLSSVWVSFRAQPLQLVSCSISHCQFFKLELAGGLSLEFEWMQVASYLWDSSEHSSQSSQSSSLDSLDSYLISNSFSLFFFQTFLGPFEVPNYSWY